MDFKAATAGELRKFADEKREELRHARFGSAGSKNRNVKFARNLRKEIAQAFTALSVLRRNK